MMSSEFPSNPQNQPEETPEKHGDSPVADRFLLGIFRRRGCRFHRFRWRVSIAARLAGLFDQFRFLYRPLLRRRSLCGRPEHDQRGLGPTPEAPGRTAGGFRPRLLCPFLGPLLREGWIFPGLLDPVPERRSGSMFLSLCPKRPGSFRSDAAQPWRCSISPCGGTENISRADESGGLPGGAQTQAGPDRFCFPPFSEFSTPSS